MGKCITEFQLWLEQYWFEQPEHSFDELAEYYGYDFLWKWDKEFRKYERQRKKERSELKKLLAKRRKMYNYILFQEKEEEKIAKKRLLKKFIKKE